MQPIFEVDLNMESYYTITVQKYEALSRPRQLTVGDIIRCRGFA